MKKNEYGLFTAIAMIVGIVIGSGIFFKSDNILVATGGSIALGVLVFCIAAIAIIFGSLTISQLASRSSQSGGLIAYAEENYNKSLACAFGWFQTFLYFPTLIAVVSWVAGIYICMLFGVEGTLEVQMLIGFAVMAFLFVMNTLSAKLGGLFQNASTIIKLIPLALIAIAGLIFGDVSNISLSHVTSMQSVGWIAAIAPIAFSFDGWVVATSIGHEIKDSKRNLPKALIIAPIFILYYIQGPLTTSMQAMNMAKEAMIGTLIGAFLRTILLFILSLLKIGIWGLIIATSSNIIYVTLQHIYYVKKYI